MTVFVSDQDLDYERSATRFDNGGRLIMDDAYARAHLPLVAPDHPKVISEDAARGYRMGRHETMWSLVIPVAWDELSRSSAFTAMHRALAAGPVGPKINWSSHIQRRGVLHATICGGLGRGAPPETLDEWQNVLCSQKPFTIALRGLFSGNINLGRLYSKLYPEKRDGKNTIHRVQRALGRPETSLYVLGLYNLTDDLDEPETAWLAHFIERHQNCDWLTLKVQHLWLLGARDDLALDSEVAEEIRLG